MQGKPGSRGELPAFFPDDDGGAAGTGQNSGGGSGGAAALLAIEGVLTAVGGGWYDL